MSLMLQRKVCLLGQFAVGKTSLVRRFVEGRFDDRYLGTIGVKISRRRMVVGEQEVQLLLWDLAGGEDYSRMAASYLRGAAGALIVCDRTRPDTMDALAAYTEQLQAVSPKAVTVYAGNKSDLGDEIQVSEADVAAMAATLPGPFVLTSALTGIGVEHAFELLVDRLLRSPS